jgi:uroporphyrinogen-III decarboxylase
MEMVAVLAGIETIVNCLVEAPEEFNETIAVLESKTDEAALIALQSPAECLMIPENLSSEVVGKKYYKNYVQEYEKRWIEKIHRAGKFSFIHMDGTLKGLIREVSSTGFRVIEACTPAPVGDIPLEDIRPFIQNNNILWGGIPGIYFTDLISDAEFDRFVIQVLQIMRSQPGFVMGVADQVPPGSRWERIRRVSELVDFYGKVD